MTEQRLKEYFGGILAEELKNISIMLSFKQYLSEEIRMTRSQAIENFAHKQLAKDNAWKRVRANTDLKLDVELRNKAEQADLDYKEAYRLRTKYAPTI